MDKDSNHRTIRVKVDGPAPYVRPDGTEAEGRRYVWPAMPPMGRAPQPATALDQIVDNIHRLGHRINTKE